jgi:cell wall-associated NlpC family hydrolase
MIAAVAAGSAGCATSRAVPRPFPGAPVVRTAPAGPDTTARPEGTVAGNPDPSGAVPVAPDASTFAHGATVDKPLAPDAPLAPVNGRAVAQFALGFRGVPYRLGGTDPTGFDCSGLVQYVFAQYGVSVPRIVEEQYEVGDKIDASEVKAGDLLFFNTKTRGNGASHVGIAISEDRFVHAPNSAGVVRIETLNSSYWGSRYLGARRIATLSLAGLIPNH